MTIIYIIVLTQLLSRFSSCLRFRMMRNGWYKTRPRRRMTILGNDDQKGRG